MNSMKDSASLEFLMKILNYGCIVQKDGNLLNYYLRKTVIFVTIAYLVVGTFINWMAALTSNLDAALLFFASIHLTAKFLFINRKKRLEEVIRIAKEMYADEPVDVDDFCIGFARVFFGFVLLYVPFNVAVSLFRYFIFEEQTLPFQIYSPLPFVQALILQNFTVTLCILEINIFTIVLVSITKNLCEHLKKLQLNFQIDKKSFRHHQNIMRLTKSLNKAYGGILLLEITLSSFQSCFAGYRLVKEMQSPNVEIITSILSFVLSLAFPFLVCYCGEELKLESENLHREVYNRGWHEKVKGRKDLFCVTLNTVKALSINYRGFIDFDFNRFSLVMQGTYSYMTFLKWVEFN